jgi:TonB family protein
LQKPEAATAGVQAPVAKTSNKLPHLLVYPGDVFYPEALVKKGVQGESVLEINLSKDGKATVSKVIGSSKSAELDKNAFNLINTGHYKLPENGVKYGEGAYSLSIIFLRDSVLTINKKTCAEFNTDLGFFRTTHPDESLKKLGALELVANIFTVQLVKTQGADGALKFVQAVDAINHQTIRDCAKKPGEAFVKTYVKASQQNGIKKF